MSASLHNRRNFFRANAASPPDGCQSRRSQAPSRSGRLRLVWQSDLFPLVQVDDVEIVAL